MVLEKSLLEIINGRDDIIKERNIARHYINTPLIEEKTEKGFERLIDGYIYKPISKLVMAWSPDLKEDFLKENYPAWGNSQQAEKIDETGKRFIFDSLSHMFNQHGRELIDSENVAPAYSSETDFSWSDSQFLDRYNRILSRQEDKGLTTIVVGKVPAWKTTNNQYTRRKVDKVSVGGLEEPIGNSAYIYIEADEASRPGIIALIDGNVKISENAPILYFAQSLPEGAQIKNVNFKRELQILLPKSYYDTGMFGDAMLKRGTPSK